MEKQKDFFFQNVLIITLQKVLVGTAGVAQSIELQNFMAAKLKGNLNFFVLLRVALNITGHLIAKNSVNVFGTLSFHVGKEIQEVVTARLNTCLRL